MASKLAFLRMTYDSSFLHGGEFCFGGSQLLRIQASRLSKYQRTRLSQQMVLDLMVWFGGPEPIRRKDILKLGDEVGDALRSREKGSMEAGGQGWG